MVRTFPRAEDLNQEEIEYEFLIRNQPEEIYSLDLVGKQRHLRSLFKNDSKERVSYRSPLSIMEEAQHIQGRIENLEKALEKKVEAKYESRVLHYWYRVKWSKANGEEEKRIRRELSQRIESIMKRFQFGPPQSPVIGQINNILTGSEGAVGGHLALSPRSEQGNTRERTASVDNDSERITGTKHKYSLALVQDDPSVVTVSRGEWEQMKKTLAELTAKLVEVNLTRDNTTNCGIQSRLSGDANQENAQRPTTFDNALQQPSLSDREWQRTAPPPPPNSRRTPTEHVDRDTRPTMTQPRTSNLFHVDEQETSSDDEVDRQPRHQFAAPRTPYEMIGFNQPGRPHGRYQRNRNSATMGSEVDDFSYSDYDNRFQHRRPFRGGPNYNQMYQNRIEKWKLRFSGDQRSVSVENFLYKAKKLADREGIPREILLRDVHMLLEGSASDWFFTFVDELQTWENFETSITYRFGNPNMDQGIRSKIHERKQLRGEPFIAFVSEIEKLDRMLSRPLSKRRKFEVVWDNMRQHYRSKISLVEVKDLQQLIRLNHRIDAADPQLQQQPGEFPNRRPVHQIEAEYSDCESDRSAPINAIGGRYMRAPRQENLQRSTREQQNAAPNQTVNQLSCWNCQEQGHGWRQCQKPKVVFCYGCGNLGRTIRNCERCCRAEGVNQQGNE